MANTVIFPTLAQIRQRVRFYIDEPTQANFTDSDLNWAINDAQQEVATEISLVDERYFVATAPTIITTVAGQGAYPLASDFWKLIRLEDVNTGLRLELSNFSDDNNFMNSGIIPPLVQGNSVGYTPSIVGNSLMLRPTPFSAGTTMQYWYVPVLPSMQLDADVSVMPPQFIDLLAMQAGIDAKIKDEDDTAALERKYSRRFNQLVRGTRDRQQQNPKKVTRISDTNFGVTL